MRAQNFHTSGNSMAIRMPTIGSVRHKQQLKVDVLTPQNDHTYDVDLSLCARILWARRSTPSGS